MSAVARRYARALFALAREADTLEESAAALAQVAGLARDAGLGPVLRSPLLSPQRRRSLADSLARELALPDLLGRFVRLLADHRRLGELPAIDAYVQQLLDEALGRVRLSLRSAGALAAEQQAELLALFAARTGRRIIPTVTVDAELLGGVVVEVQGRTYDGSVRTQLDRLARRLTGGASL